MENQNKLVKLLSTPPALRDLNWQNKVFELFKDAQLTLEDDTPRTGPDGMPYILASVKTDSKEPIRKLCQWLYEKGIGLVINPQKDEADFVFSYGMIWSFLATSNFIPNTESTERGKTIEIKEGQKYYFGDLTDQIIPNIPRELLKEFFGQSKITDPKVKLMSVDQKSFDICFSRESLDGLTEDEEKSLMEKLSWFLPRHYSMAIVTTKNMPAEFMPL